MTEEKIDCEVKSFPLFAALVFLCFLLDNSVMEKKSLDRNELKKLNKDELIDLIVSLQTSVDLLNQNLEVMMEALKVKNQRSFGVKSEVNSSIEQMQLEGVWFDETEFTLDELQDEPVIEKVAPKKKAKGKKASDLSKVTNHSEVSITISDEELDRQFGKGNWKKMPDYLIPKLEHHPAYFEVVTYHIGVYSCKDETKNPGDVSIIRAELPVELQKGSIVTPSLLSSILLAKYVNHVPLYRQEKAFENCDIYISRKNMANWIIRSYNDYLSALEPYFKKKLMESEVIHADETPFLVTKDGRKAGSKSYMWVYRSRQNDDKEPVIIYEYQKDRKTEHPEEFLSDYNGFVVCDGYGAYKKVEKDSENILISGCWVHCKRKYAEYLKSGPSNNKWKTLSQQAVEQISHIYHLEHMSEGMNELEHLQYRQNVIEPWVDKFFMWAKENSTKVPEKSQIGRALQYTLNQEKYLRRFLENASLPLDNNAAERAIRSFTIGRKNFVMIDTPKGAEASAFLYSLVETAKANNLKLYDYINYLLTELPKVMRNGNKEIPDSLLPWSKELPPALYKEKQPSDK